MINYNLLWKEIDEIAKENSFDVIEDYEKTLDQLRMDWGLGYRKVKALVERLIKEGKMGSRQATGKNGKICIVYFPIKKTPNR